AFGSSLREVATVELEASLALLGGVEVGEEGQQSRVLTRRHELLGDLDEAVDAVQRVSGADVGTGRELDVEAERAADGDDELGQRLARPATQRTQLVAQGSDPSVALR